METPTTPKLSIPLTMGSSGFQTVEQDSETEVAACVYAIVATPLGSRVDDPDFGVEDPTFDTLPLDPREVLAQVAIYEPAARVEVAQEVEELAGTVVVGVGA